MSEKANELKVFNTLVSALQELEGERAEEVLRSVLTFLGMSIGNVNVSHSRTLNSTHLNHDSASTNTTSPAFSENRAITPKQFLLEKKPQSNVERIACLAYYLTHYREMPHFKTIDLSKLNTEAAQPKFSNAAVSANDANLQGYLAAATKGQKQLSGAGELYVSNLPDRLAAKEAMKSMSQRRRTVSKKSKTKKAANEK